MHHELCDLLQATMDLTETASNTDFHLAASFNNDPYHKLLMELTYPLSLTYRPCLIKAHCQTCDNDVSCLEAADALLKTPLASRNVTTFGSNLQYQCRPGMEFENVGTTVPTFNISCQWDETWTPRDTLPKCICKYSN